MELQSQISSRLRDILDELVGLHVASEELCAEAVKLHSRKQGDHVRTDNGGDGVILHVSCKLSTHDSNYKLIVTEHIAALSLTGRPTKIRLHRSYVTAEEWLIRVAPLPQEPTNKES